MIHIPLTVNAATALAIPYHLWLVEKWKKRKVRKEKKKAPLILCNDVYFFVYQNNVNVKKAQLDILM